MSNLSYYCPRLTSLLITRNSSRPSKHISSPAAEMDLTKVFLYLPYDNELLDNLHHYQAVNDLRIYPDMTYVCTMIIPHLKYNGLYTVDKAL